VLDPLFYGNEVRQCIVAEVTLGQDLIVAWWALVPDSARVMIQPQERPPDSPQVRLGLNPAIPASVPTIDTKLHVAHGGEGIDKMDRSVERDHSCPRGTHSHSLLGDAVVI